MQRNRKHAKLAFVVAVYTALVIAGGMAVYAAYQYLMTPDHTALGLLFQHGWHVAALGALVYLTLGAVLYRKVVVPLQELDVKLYAISKGDFSPVELKTGPSEVQEIAAVVNFLLREMRRAVPAGVGERLAADSAALRALASDPQEISDKAMHTLMDVARDVDRAVEALSVDGLRHPGGREEGAA